MSTPAFTHLHVHTHYSLLDGACKVPDLVKRCKSLGMDSLAISDHGCLFGVIEFYNECKKQGVKPILGMETYMAPGDRRERTTPSGTGADAAYHLLLLAETLEGYQNLLKLGSLAYKEGFYYKPRIDKEILREFSRGLIATSACLGGEIPSAFMKRDAKAARRIAETYLQIFGPDRFFIEVQKQGVKEQDLVNPELVEIASKLGCGTVATNDVHFLNKEDHYAHDVLCCISMGRLVSDENRLKYPTELYLKSPAEMHQALAAFPEALANTGRIAQMCNVELDFSKRYAPVYRVPAEKLSEAVVPAAEMREDERYLRQLCEEGLTWRYGMREVPQDVRDRLEKELKVIVSKNFCSYFLIVWDFCNYARDHGIPVGARGSGVGTMVGYLLGLCNVDPLRYGLLFERFMDPSRNEMPDIDIDICQDGRQKVIEYVRQKYGHVAQIITFGTLAAKAACKDVGRVLGVPLAEIDKLTKLIPASPGMTLDKALAASPELNELYKSNPTIQNVINIAKRLEGLCRNAGCHAAGVVIADQPLENFVPLYKSGEDILTQFEGPIVEKVGLLKMDFLGLRTLTTLERALDLELQTREARGGTLPPNTPLDSRGRIDIERIDFTDRKVLDLFCRGETRGIFQFESGGMQDLLMKMQPDRIEDLIAANALYRPGPMELIPLYCNRKHGRERVPQVHPIMDQILAETYSIMCYQEQVMQVFNQLGGIELSAAYKLIKAISKKQSDVIAKYKPEFISGTMGKGVSKDQAEEIFDLILKFGGYGFNKCVVGQTNIVHAKTGEQITVEELFRNKRPFMVHALGEDGKLHPRRVADVVWNGRKPVYELRTAQGRSIIATANHPMRTWDGWKNLGDLRPGDRIASARRLNVPSQKRWQEHELIVLAGLLAEGNTCHPTCLYFYGNDRQLVEDFATAAGQFDFTAARIYEREDGRRLEVCVSTGRDARFKKGDHPWNWPAEDRGGCATLVQTKPHARSHTRSGAFRWIERLGLIGLKATQKHVPQELFTLCDADLELFLGRLWAGDGFIATADLAVPYCATSSPQLARDVQTLLLRLGIIGGIHRKTFNYRGGSREGFTVHLLGEGSIETFARRIGPHCLGREPALRILQRHLRSTDRGRSSKDTIPPQVRTWVDEERQKAGLTWRELEERSDLSMKEFYGKGSRAKRGFQRNTLRRLATFFASERLAQVADSDIFWDRIVSIEPRGIQETYDLTVEVDHNFIADGLVTHNSHSTRYAIVAFQTAFMKTYFPIEYMAALLTFEMGSTDKVVEYIEECRRINLPDGGRGIGVLPPDVNVSNVDFTPIYNEVEDKKKGKRQAKSDKKTGVIRFGLGAVKGVGAKAVEGIISARTEGGSFKSIYDFCDRVDLRQVNRATTEALIKCGAFASTRANRAQLQAALDRAIEMGQQSQQDRRMGQLNMFGAPAAVAPGAAGISIDALPDVEEFKSAELLKFEKEVLGFYITSHPLTEHQSALEHFSTDSTRQAANRTEGSEITIGGMITRVKKSVTKNGRSAGMTMAMITLEDLEGQIDGVVFAENYAEIQKRGPIVEPERIVFMRGKVDKRRETPSIIVNDMIPIEEAPAKLTTALLLKLDPQRHTPQTLDDLKPLLESARGGTPVFVQVPVNGAQVATVRLDNTLFIRPSQELAQDLQRLLGPGQAQLCGLGTRRRQHSEQRPLFKEPTLDPEPPMMAEAAEMEDSAMEM